MGKTVDDRVVAMSFENAKFEANAKQTISTLDRLKQALHLPGATKGLQDVAIASDKLKGSLDMKNAARGLNEISNTTKGINFGTLTNGLETVKASFSALQVVAVSALATIASKAVTTGLDVVKSLTVTPVTGGLREYETQLNAVQTILANTQASGATLKDVNKALDELNTYSDKTIYNFSEMARNIGTFTAAGVDLKTATGSIKGIANLAALSGSNSQQASTAMYQLSQAISAGRVSLQDWNSVVNAGMGGTVFQRALAQTAVNMGKLDEGAVKLTGKMKNVSIAGESFRQSIQGQPGKDSWLTSDVLTKTLQQFTGDLSDAELKAQGFNDAQIKAIQAQAKTAQEAATKVKTMSQLLSTARETAESGWGQTWRLIFGNFGEARKTFTSASNALNDLINNNAEARNAVLKEWKDLGGRTALISGITNIFKAAAAVLGPIKETFREFFPAKTGKDLFEFTKRFEAFTKSLIPGKERIAVIQRIFAGIFAVMSIGKQIVSELFGVFKRLFGVAGESSGGILEFVASIGDFLVFIDKAIKESESFSEIFVKMGDILQKPIVLIQKLGSAIAGLFAGGSGSGGSGGPSLLTGILDGLVTAAEAVISVFEKLGEAIKSAFGDVEFNDVVDAITVGLLGGILVAVKKFITDFSVDISGGLLGSITGSFDQLTGTLKAMQNGIQADTLMKIAIAVGVLTVSIVALSKIDGDSLKKALSGIAAAFAMLLAAMAIIAKISATGGFVKIPVLAASMILLAVAVDALVIAVYALSKLSWEELGKGLAGIAALLVMISAAAVPLSKNSGGMLSAGIGIAALAVGLKILASAIEDFAAMSWETIGKGLLGVASALVAIGLAMKLVPPNIALAGVGLIAVAVGLNLLVNVVKAFGGMDFMTAAKGLGVMTLAILAIGLAAAALPKSLALQAAGLLLLSVALGAIVASIAVMGAMSIETVAKGLGALALSLLILAGGLKLMSGSIGGAAALILAAAALNLLVPPIMLLGTMSIESIVKSLVAMAGAFAVLGIAGAVVGPLAPALLALGASLVIAGAGMLAFGAGVALLGAGLAAMVAVGPAAIVILVKAFLEIAKVLPKVAVEVGKGIVLLVQTIAAAAPQLAVAIGQLISALLQAIIINAPLVGQTLLVLLTTALNVLRTAIPMVVTTGLEILAALLRGLAQNIGAITTAAAQVVINFLTAITAKLPELVTAGAKFLLELMKGISRNITQITRKGLEIVAKFISAIASKLGDVVDAGADVIKELIKGLGKNAGGVAEAAGEALGEFVRGIGEGLEDLITAGTKMLKALIRGIGKNAADLAESAMDTLLKFLWAIEDAISVYAPQITEACGAIGIAIVAGVGEGLAGLARMLIDKLISPIQAAVDKAKGLLKIKSPSRVFIEIGKQITKGFEIGLTVGGRAIPFVIAGLAKDAISAFNKAFKIDGPLAQIQKNLTDFISDTFRTALRGSIEDIDSAFLELNKTITDNMTQLKTDIKSFKDEIKSLQDSRAAYKDKKKPSKKEQRQYRAEGKEIDELRDKISSYNQEYNRLLNGRKKFVDTVNPEVAALKALQTELTKVTADIGTAQSAYDSLKSSRDSFVQGVVDRYSTLPSLDGKSLSKYIKDLTKLTSDTEAYGSLLNQLRGMGLDDTTYKMLLDQGVAGKKFAEQLLAAGPGQIAALNSLNSRMQTAAQSMGTAAAAAMYDAGVATAKGLLDGLQADQEGLLKAVEEMADKIIKKMKTKLKIKSPSRVFAEIGKQTAEGMAVGLSASTSVVSDAASSMADAAMESLRSSMSQLNSVISDEIITDPVIRPILDLSDVEASAKRLTNIGATSYGYASNISAAQMQSLDDVVKSVSEPTEIKFEQNNYSPEALSSLEIYRQTNNQLAKTKAALLG